MPLSDLQSSDLLAAIGNFRVSFSIWGCLGYSLLLESFILKRVKCLEKGVALENGRRFIPSADELAQRDSI